MAGENPCERRRVGDGIGEGALSAAAGASALSLSAPSCCYCGSAAISVAAPLVMSRTAAGTHLSANVPPCMALVEFTGAMTLGATSGVDDDALSGVARIVSYSRADNVYGAPAGQPEVSVYYSVGPRDGGGAPLGPAPLAVGDRGWAFFNAHSGRWELVERDRGPWRFELTSTLSPGGSGTAEIVAWDGIAWTTTGQTITVYDSLDMFGGVAGARGLVTWRSDSQRWEITQIDSCECSAAGPTCINVLTGVSVSGENLVFSRVQLCLPASVTITELTSLSVEGCCGGDGEPTEP
jgi:hypothetical protein